MATTNLYNDAISIIHESDKDERDKATSDDDCRLVLSSNSREDYHSKSTSFTESTLRSQQRILCK